MAFVFVKQSASVGHNGAKVRLSKGDAWDDGDPVVKAFPDMFSKRPEVVKSSVEVVSKKVSVFEDDPATLAAGSNAKADKAAKAAAAKADKGEKAEAAKASRPAGAVEDASADPAEK